MIYASSSSSLSILYESMGGWYGWNLEDTDGFHSTFLEALHCTCGELYHPLWIQVKLKPEKLNLPWLILKISTEWQSTKTGKQYKQVHSCLFQQVKLARVEPGFSSGSWQLCGHSGNVLISLETSMFG